MTNSTTLARRATTAWLLALALGSTLALALFADQAGLNDWTKQHVGEVTIAVPLVTGRTFAVATAQGVLAALLQNTGDIVWRRVMPKGEAKIEELLVKKDILVARSANNVKAWNSDGQLLWDYEASEIRDAEVTEDDSVWILTSDKLLSFNLLTGAANPKNSRDLAPAVKSALMIGGGSVRVVTGDSGVIKVVDSAGSVSEFKSSATDFAVLGNARVAFYKDGSENIVVVKDFTNGKLSEIASQTSTSLSSSPDGNHLMMASGASVKLITVSPDGSSSTTELATSAFATTRDCLFSFQADKTVQKICKDGSSSSLDTSSEQECSKAWAVDDSAIVVLYADGSLSLLELASKSLRTKWTREEALAEVVQIVSTYLPHVSESTGSSTFGQLTRLISNLNSMLTATSAMAQSIFEAGVRVAKGGEFELKSVLESSEEERARFGFNRVLIMLTRKNKLFGIHSETGLVLWTRSLSLNGFSKPVLAVVHESDPNPRFIVLDIVSGAVELVSSVSGIVLKSTQSISNGKNLLQFIMVDSITGDRVKTLVALTEDLSVVEYPEPAKRSLETPLFVNVLDKSKNLWSGYRIESGAKKATVAWTLSLPSTSQVITVASPLSFDPVFSSVRPLGDGSLLVKYVNPHLSAMAVKDEGIKIILVDTVSGRVVHRASHKDASEPVHMVRFENWLVYSYWSTKAKRFELVVTSMYEKTPIGKRQLNPWSAVPTILETNITGFDALDVSFVTRSYLLSGWEITALGATSTLRGIAAKNLLVSLGGTGQVLMLDQRLIDPRRTSQPPTEEEKLEGLFQYHPDLPITPTHVLSYYRGAGELGARLFYVAPSHLESTCTVLAAGLDIFKGRASPSGTFDLLAEDFNYSLLVLLILVLGALVVVLRTMEKRKSLEASWA